MKALVRLFLQALSELLMQVPLVVKAVLVQPVRHLIYIYIYTYTYIYINMYMCMCMYIYLYYRGSTALASTTGGSRRTAVVLLYEPLNVSLRVSPPMPPPTCLSSENASFRVWFEKG